MAGDHRPEQGARRGFVFGELLIALLLLVVAVSSLAALMYSVSRRPTTSAETECVVSDAARGKCVPAQPAPKNPESKLLRSGCETRSVYDRRECKDSVGPGSGETVIKPRTDSAAMALLAKRQKEREERPDRGFIR